MTRFRVAVGLAVIGVLAALFFWLNSVALRPELRRSARTR
jgi:hypothetical protein